jgi:hypothetical protein
VIKATGKGLAGRETLFIGLSFGNLDRFREQPLDTFIKIDGQEVGLSHDIVIFSGRTEAEMADLMAGGFGTDTKVVITGRSKN